MARRPGPQTPPGVEDRKLRGSTAVEPDHDTNKGEERDKPPPHERPHHPLSRPRSLRRPRPGDTAASLVAEHDREIVGHVQLSRSWFDAPERLVAVLVLSPLSVRPDRQGRGIGTALLAAAVEAAALVGAPALLLEGPPGHYGAHGFTRADAHGFTRPSVRIPEEALQVALLPAHEPWMTGALVYCQAFWTTDSVGLR